MASRPLEAPRPLPTAFHAMASAITGRARPPLFTTGPATRAALSAAGALGATTGTVVHLPAVPTSSGPAVAAVLAHELTHTRSPVRRPRFLLDGASALLDDDERQALAAGRDRAGQAAATGAGIVDSLPVGGGMGAVGEVATRAARAAVLEAAASPVGSAFSGLSAMGSSAMSAATGALGSAGTVASEAVSDTASGAMSAVAGAASGAVAQATTAVGGVADAARNALDPDKIVEIVEQRLLREIERRGGRWAGVF
ncbi:eCIS core domain-containing protein [Micromonosporaceae bacterium Da 78-11]